jgi:hypothetical protein
MDDVAVGRHGLPLVGAGVTARIVARSGGSVRILVLTLLSVTGLLPVTGADGR